MIRHPGWRLVVVALAGMCFLTGCPKPEAPKPQQSAYPDVGIRPGLPPYLRDTVYERTDVSNTGALAVTSFGLVVNLRYPGDTRAPLPVRDWMIKQMYAHGFDNYRVDPRYKQITPEFVLSDKRTAIVMVGAYLPAGARKGQHCDVIVQAMPGNDTTSLAGGTLYQCPLRIMGANPLNPGSAVNNFIQARGPIFVNPAHALELPSATDGAARSSARIGTIMGGGLCVADRPLHLRLRTPQWNISRAVEAVINQRFQAEADRSRLDGRGLCVAESQDEGYLHIYVPRKYNGNWEHFMGVVNHLYMNITPGAASQKAMELAAAARMPGAPLENISYALEGLGHAAIPAIVSLINNPTPEIAYAAARAGAFLAHTGSEDALIRMAQANGHPFRVNAIQILGELPFNTEINRGLTACIDAEESLVRIEAYKVLSKHSGDPRLPTPISTKVIQESFAIDLVESKGKPMIYATRTGEPRLAIFGPRMSLRLPMTFSAFDTRLTIATHPQKTNLVSIFYRNEGLEQPISTVSGPLVYELVARLGGASDDNLRFAYGEVIGMLQSMADKGRIVVGNTQASLVLQDLPGMDMTDFMDNPGGGRQVGEMANPAKVQANGGAAAAANPQSGTPSGRPN